jgi:PAS domain S-box-containing protein
MALDMDRKRNYVPEDLLAKVPAAIAMVEGSSYIFRFTNPLYQEVFGKKDYLGKPGREVFPEFNSQGIWSIFDKIFSSGEAFIGKEMPIELDRKGDGKLEMCYFNLVVQPIKKHGVVKRLLIHAVEKTDLVLAKRQIKEDELAYKHLADSMPQIVWTAQSDGHVDYYNKKWKEITGIDPNELNNNSWIQILFPGDTSICRETWSHSVNTGDIFEMEARIRTVNTKEPYTWFLIRALPVKNENGTVQKWVGTFTDIHDYKIMQHQKENFLAVASHELKTPVTGIKAYAQILETICRNKGYKEETALLVMMNKQITRLTSLVGDLLDITKIQNGKMEFDESAFDFNELILEATEQMKVTSTQHMIDLELSKGKMVYADRNRIRQVINNLISNAIKYSPDKNKILVRSSSTENDVFLCVDDYGIGIAKDQFEKVFEQFYRVTGDKQNTFPGLGIGLYISSEIIKRQGGKIWVESIEGKGSTFCFTLPVYHIKR